MVDPPPDGAASFSIGRPGDDLSAAGPTVVRVPSAAMDDATTSWCDDPPLRAGVRTYHPRRGRLHDASRTRVSQLLTRYGLPPGPLDPATLFAGRPVVVEIGFGMGEATLQLAHADPETGIVAVDVHTPGVLRVLSAIESDGLDNLRVAHEDAVALLHDRVAPASLAGVRVWFPDPWPKLRHHKRRLVQPRVVAMIASRLRIGGLLHLATDVPGYAEQMLLVTSAEPLLCNDFGGYAPRPSWRPTTRYERLGTERSRPVNDLVLRRV